MLVLLILALAVPSEQLEELSSASSSSEMFSDDAITTTTTSSDPAAAAEAEREVAALLADRPGVTELGRQRLETLSSIAHTAAGVGSSIAQDASHRAAARLKAAKILKGRVVDDAATKAAAMIREQQRLAAESARSARFQRHVQDGLAEIVWVAAVTATLGGALFTRRVLGWGETRSGSSYTSTGIRGRVPTTPEDVAEEARLKDEIRRQDELSKRDLEANQNPLNYTDVTEMRRRGVGHRLGLVDQLVRLRGGVSSPEELERARVRERETDLQHRHERWRLGCEVTAAACGATFGSLFSLGMNGVRGMSGGGIGDDDARLAGRRSFGTIFGALVGTLVWLLVEPWAVSRFALGPLVGMRLSRNTRLRIGV